MKISCHIIQDLLPLYHDGVCSKESEQLVKEHLQKCEDCQTVLSAIREDLEETVAFADDDRELRLLQKAWKSEKKASFRKGIRIGAIAVICIIILILTVIFVPIPHYYDITYENVYRADGSKADVTVELNFWKLNYLIPKDRQKGTLIITDHSTGAKQEYIFDRVWPRRTDRHARAYNKKQGYSTFGRDVMPALIQLYTPNIAAEISPLEKYQYYGTIALDKNLENLAIYISPGGAEHIEAAGKEAVLLATSKGASFEELAKDIFSPYLLYYVPGSSEQ